MLDSHKYIVGSCFCKKHIKKGFIIRLLLLWHTYNFLSYWSVPKTEMIVIDPLIIDRWIINTNTKIIIYYEEFKFLKKLIDISLKYIGFKNI